MWESNASRCITAQPSPQSLYPKPCNGFTGEVQQGNDVWLRARWYGAGRGGFGSRDAFVGRALQPITFQPYLYSWNDPILHTDPSGQIVDCGSYPWEIKQLCVRANVDVTPGSSGWDDAIDAREQIDYALVAFATGARHINHSYIYFAYTMLHFLEGNGSDLKVVMPANESFFRDPGITRATTGVGSPIYSASYEPEEIFPLLHDFLWNYVQPAAKSGASTVAQRIEGNKPRHCYSNPHDDPDNDIRPVAHDKGYWAAFGHVAIDGNFTASIDCRSEGYIIDYQVNYQIIPTLLAALRQEYV